MKQSQQNVSLQPELPDWEISDLYKRSFKIIKKFKVLWIFGAAIAGAASFSGLDSASRLNDTGYKFFQDLFNSPQASKILGDSTSYFNDLFPYLFSQIPVWAYVLLGIEFFALLIIGIIINLVKNSWEIGSLLSGIELTNKNKTVSIEESSSQSFPHVKSLIWLNFVPSFFLVTFFILGVVLCAAGIKLLSDPLRLLFILLLIMLILTFIVLSSLLGLSKIWAQREIVISDKSGKQALFDGYKIVKKKFWAMILLGLVNSILSLLIVGSVIGVLAGLILGGIISFDSNSAASIGLIALSVILAIGFVALSPLLSGIMHTFKAAVWSLAYKNIEGKYDK